MDKETLKKLISETEKHLSESAENINRLSAMREEEIARGNKLVGKLEAYNELLKEEEENAD